MGRLLLRNQPTFPHIKLTESKHLTIFDEGHGSITHQRRQSAITLPGHLTAILTATRHVL